MSTSLEQIAENIAASQAHKTTFRKKANPIYALRHIESKKLLGVNIRATPEGSDFCGDYVARLTLSSDNVWTIKSFERAVHVRDNSTEWYNAEYLSPTNDFVGQCEIVTLYSE